MSRKATIDNLFIQKPATPTGSVASSPDRVRTGAISAMGSSLKELTEGARAATRLQEQLAAGTAVIEIDPKDIAGSFVADRIATDADPHFDELVDSLRMSGQQVPILVRPMEGGRFQIAYGHRRVRACAKLGIKVKAVVRDLTNDELVVAQGKENLDRKDLSFIEKALFARRLEDQGFDRAVIMAALSTEKGNLSRYITVARAIPEKLVQAIGPAGKAGRARWTILAERLPGREHLADAATEAPEFTSLDSDGRFAAVLRALSQPGQKATSWACGKAARIDRRDDRTVLTIDESIAPEFGAYLADRLEDLFRDYVKRRDEAI
ncbi:plasmid partitioning protein RepB [Methylobacterium sp. ID0610]|uniref:plasmid partitioning protein RepB n=1 Tax=Methylobacterium carpenticola TaxID=3344827 RepID=UPI0036B72701